jgi:ketosteroid isomerase-like protein
VLENKYIKILSVKEEKRQAYDSVGPAGMEDCLVFKYRVKQRKHSEEYEKLYIDWYDAEGEPIKTTYSLFNLRGKPAGYFDVTSDRCLRPEGAKSYKLWFAK